MDRSEEGVEHEVVEEGSEEKSDHAEKSVTETGVSGDNTSGAFEENTTMPTMTKTAAAVYHVNEEDARDLLDDCGMHAAKTAPLKKITSTLNDLLARRKIMRQPTERKHIQLMARLCAALDDDLRIVVLTDKNEDGDVDEEANGRPASSQEEAAADVEEGESKHDDDRKSATSTAQRENSIETKRVSIDKIVEAGYNPPKRSHLSRKPDMLEKSMIDKGILVPLLITKEYRLIDGHRRLSRAMRLGWETVPCLIADEDESPEHIYADVNAYSKHLAGHDILHVGLQEPEALTPRQYKEVEKAIDDLGKFIMNQIEKEGKSLQVYRTAKGVARYVHKEDDTDFLKKAARWLIKHGASRMREAMRADVSVKEILKAIDRDVKM